MTRTVVRHDFKDATGKPGIKVTFYCENEPEALAVIAAGQAAPKAAAFTPALSAGEAFDSAEVVPPAAPGWCNAPPNCGLPPSEIAHFGQEPTQAGQVLAHAQHEAAIDGLECTATACLMARGAND